MSAEQPRRKHVPVKQPPITGHRLITIGILCFVAVQLIASLLDPALRLWGLNFSTYLLPDADIVLLLTLPFLLLFPGVERAAASLFKEDNRDRSLVFVLVIGILLSIGVWFLQIPVAYLGDGSTYVSDIFRIKNVPGHVPIMIKPTAFLTGHVLQWLTVALQPTDMHTPFVVVGIAGLALVLAGLVMFARKEGQSVSGLVVLLFLLTPASVFFFGYVELYALTYAFVLLFFICMFLALRGKVSVAIPGICLLLAGLFGMSALAFLPAYLLLLFRNTAVIRRFSPVRTAMILCGGVVVFVVALYGWIGLASDNAYLIPIRPMRRIFEGSFFGSQEYTLLSLPHLADIGNVLLLTAGIPLAIVVTVAMFHRRNVDWADPMIVIGWTSAFLGLFALCVGNTFLGLARDWDVSTIPLAGILFFAVTLLVHLHERRRFSLSHILPVLVLASGSQLALWLRVNLDEDASRNRFADLVAQDAGLILPMNTYTGFEHLKKDAIKRKDISRLLEVSKSMIRTDYRKLRSYREYLSVLQSIGNPGEKREGYLWLFTSLKEAAGTQLPETHFGNIPAPDLRQFVVFALVAAAQSLDAETLEAAGREFQQFFRPWDEFDLVTALTSQELAPLERVKIAERALSGEVREPSLVMMLGQLYDAAQQWTDAIHAYEQGLALAPTDYPQYYIRIARIYLEQLGNEQKGLEVLRRCIASCKGTPEAREAEAVVRSLGK